MSEQTANALASQICIVVAVNDDAALAHNLMQSDLVARHGVPVHFERGASSASVAYNRGIDGTDAPLIIFVHQDVYLPSRWLDDLARALDAVSRLDPNWGLLAPFGVSRDLAKHRGEVWTTSLSRRVGDPVDPDHPISAQSFDELAFVMRRVAGLRFDEGLPLFHLYGTDIVQTAWAAGVGAYIAHLPTVHNDGFHGKLGADFTAGYTYVRRKWWAQLPLRTPVVRIRWHGLDLPLYRLRAARSMAGRRAMAGDTDADPRGISARCGWDAD